MNALGYTLSSEEHDANTLVKNAAMAEAAGFEFVSISDHFHPWLDEQGQSPFVWSVLGGIAQVTKNLRVMVGVTCPIIRIHPVVIAHAAATTAQMIEGRFILGVGTGENLNEHVVGMGWPPITVRQEMLEEAVTIIRMVWKGKLTSYEGKYYTVEDARIYTLPKVLPPIYIAAAGKNSAELAIRLGDGFISTSPKKELLSLVEKKKGKDFPRYGQVNVCYSKTEKKAVDTAYHYWRNTLLGGPVGSEFRLPSYFNEASKAITPEKVHKEIACGPDPEKHMKEIQKFIDAGYTHLYIHQIGPEQEAFMQFYKKEILPKFNH